MLTKDNHMYTIICVLWILKSAFICTLFIIKCTINAQWAMQRHFLCKFQMFLHWYVGSYQTHCYTLSQLLLVFFFFSNFLFPYNVTRYSKLFVAITILHKRPCKTLSFSYAVILLRLFVYFHLINTLPNVVHFRFQSVLWQSHVFAAIANRTTIYQLGDLKRHFTLVSSSLISGCGNHFCVNIIRSKQEIITGGYPSGPVIFRQMFPC